MLVNDFLKLVSMRLGDEAKITYSNKELIAALNDAITQLSLERIASGDALMIKEITVTPSITAIPYGFVRFVGNESVYPLNGKFMSLDGTNISRNVRCFCTKKHVETKGDEIPFDDTTSLGVLLNYVVVLVGARTGEQSPVETELAQRMSNAYHGKVKSDADKIQETQ